jgi:pantothenate kinase
METPQHLAKAALLMITNNIGSLAKLHAQATGVENVLFTGSFMHRNKVIIPLPNSSPDIEFTPMEQLF